MQKSEHPFHIDFFQTAEHESAETHVVFDVSEDRFGFNTAEFAQGNSLLGEQVFFCWLAIAAQFKANLDLAIAFGFCAFGFEGTGGTV
jgi:hypothetical protein